MNEVEKMYENAEPNRNCNLYKHFTKCPMKHTQCEDCENFVYPPFTAEKQLELIKFLLDKYCDIRIRKNLEGDYYIKSFNDISCFSEDFEETLASFMNTHLQDLTEEEKQQVKGILE